MGNLIFGTYVRSFVRSFVVVAVVVSKELFLSVFFFRGCMSCKKVDIQIVVRFSLVLPSLQHPLQYYLLYLLYFQYKTSQHPADFTPVCTTEIGRLALKYDELKSMDCLVATLSVDPVKSHEEWLRDVVAHCENNIDIKFPIIGDADRKISTAYGMLDAGEFGLVKI